MKFTLLENKYDDQGNDRVNKFFTKVMGWIQGAGSKSRDEWKRILMKDYSQYLVGSGSNIAQNDLCESCNGSCSTCFVKNEDKGDSEMTLDKEVEEAFGEKKKPELKDERGFQVVHRIGKDGQLVQTKQSELDEKAYRDEHKQEIVEESSNLSLDEEIQEALGKTGYNSAKYL